MSTSTSTATVFAPYTHASVSTGPILIASDASQHADAAFPLAAALAARTGAEVQVVSAIRPFAMPMYAFDVLPSAVETDAAAREGREGMVRMQLAKLISPTAEWPVRVLTGEPAREIVDAAQEINARVIVVGRGRHAAPQRALSGETVLRLLQLGDAPVYAAEAGAHEVATHVVIATDFSEFSVYAAEVALSLVAPDAHITLVHVAPPFAEVDAGLQVRAVAYRNQVTHAFAQLRDRLARPGLTFHDVLAVGNPSDELIKTIRSTNAELVVTATHGYGFLRRMVLGSVAAELVRHAPCSVLCVPGSAQTLSTLRAHNTLTSRTREFSPDVMDVELAQFAARNAGRRCAVEVDYPELGAQILGHGLPLVGATYDHRARSVALMFGASALNGQHLTHTIDEVSSVIVSTDTQHREQALRIHSGDGQTLVMLE